MGDCVKISPRHSPNTNGFNNHNVVQCSNSVLERSAAEPLIVTLPTVRPVKRIPTSLSYTKICYSIAAYSTSTHHTVLSCRLLTEHHTKNTKVTKILLSYVKRRLNIHRGMSAYTSASQAVLEVQHVASDPPKSP